MGNTATVPRRKNIQNIPRTPQSEQLGCSAGGVVCRFLLNLYHICDKI